MNSRNKSSISLMMTCRISRMTTTTTAPHCLNSSKGSKVQKCGDNFYDFCFWLKNEEIGMSMTACMHGVKYTDWTHTYMSASTYVFCTPSLFQTNQPSYLQTELRNTEKEEGSFFQKAPAQQLSLAFFADKYKSF